MGGRIFTETLLTSFPDSLRLQMNLKREDYQTVAITRRAMKEADEMIHPKHARYQNGTERIGDLEKIAEQ